jgi:hypothetical protein
VRAWLTRNAVLADGENPRIVDFLVRRQPSRAADIAYTVRMEPGVQTPDHTLSAALGSCRDSAWLLVSILREARPGGPLRLRLPRPADRRQ